MEAGDLDPNGPQFSVSLFNPISRPSCRALSKLFFAAIAPWYVIAIAAERRKPSSPREMACYMILMGVPFYAWIAMMVVELMPVHGISYVGWAVLFLFFGVATAIRTGIREQDEIHGNMVEDFFVVMLLYPFAAYQMDQHVLNHQTKKNGDTEQAHSYDNPAHKVIDGRKISEMTKL